MSLMTVREASKELSLAEVTLRSMIAKRIISYVKLGRSVRIPRSECERLVSSCLVARADYQIRSKISEDTIDLKN